jgi:hypothetical protein
MQVERERGESRRLRGVRRVPRIDGEREVDDRHRVALEENDLESVLQLAR